MVYPPGQGKSGPRLMELWRQYLEQYAENEGNPEEQALVGAYHASALLGTLARILDRDDEHADEIDRKEAEFDESSRQTLTFESRVLHATHSIYSQLNIIGRQFTGGNFEAANLIRQIEDRVEPADHAAGPVERSASALRASFALVGLMTLAVDQIGTATDAIRQVEQRFASAANAATSDWEQLLNALYRTVEMMQLLVSLTDAELENQALQIASRFQEEDKTTLLSKKVRNGFCRLFELGHLLASDLDEVF